MISFFVPAGQGESELIVKRSRFLGHLYPVESEEQAKIILTDTRKAYHDARHNCWCYRIYDGSERFSDDGEPQGSAGTPMLEVFRRENVFNVICIVTRYFGGVLLGTGGLSRAYSDCAREALFIAGVMQQGQWTKVHFSCAYSVFDRVRIELASVGAVTEDLSYGEDISIDAYLPSELLQRLQLRLQEISAGRIVLSVSGPVLRSTQSFTESD